MALLLMLNRLVKYNDFVRARQSVVDSLSYDRDIPAEVATVFCGNEGLRTSDPCIPQAYFVTPHVANP